MKKAEYNGTNKNNQIIENNWKPENDWSDDIYWTDKNSLKLIMIEGLKIKKEITELSEKLKITDQRKIS